MGVGLDLKGLRKDKSEFYLEVSLNHMVHEGEMLVVAFVVDVTSRRQYELKLQEYSTKLEEMVATRTKALEKQMKETQKAELQARQSEETYKLIARNFPSGTINVFDRDLNYIFVEGQVLFEMGITGEQLIGSKYTDRLAPEISKITQEKLQQVFEGEPNSFEIEFEGKFFNINAVPLMRDKNGVSQVLVVEENITKQKLAELEVQKALEQEQKLGQLKSKFVTLASHEFRTPLATISSSASLIGKYTSTELQPKRDKHINRIQSSVKHLTNILNDFLSLGKLEEGQVKNTPAIFSVCELCSEISEEIEGQLKDGQKIRHSHGGAEEEVLLDKKLLKNALIIMLSNAMKYSDENQFIELKTEISSSTVKISVKDNGIGIPVEDQAMLFSRFYRASNTGNIQGTGMGLNILKKYVDLMVFLWKYLTKK